MTRLIGLLLGTALTGAVVTGIAGIIALDFREDWAVIFAEAEAASTPPSDPIAEIFEEVESLTFFASKRIDGTLLKVTTGASFLTPQDVAERRADEMWCYLSFNTGAAVHRQIDLGRQSAGDTPTYRKLTGLTDQDEAAIGIGRVGLEALARSHCRFDDFDPRDAKS